MKAGAAIIDNASRDAKVTVIIQPSLEPWLQRRSA